MLSRVWSNRDGPLASAYEKLHLGPSSPSQCTSALDTAYLLDLLLGPAPLTKLKDSNLKSVGVAVFQAEIGTPTVMFSSQFGTPPKTDLLFGATTLAYQGTVTRLRLESCDERSQLETWLVTRTFKIPKQAISNVLDSTLSVLTTTVDAAHCVPGTVAADSGRFQSGLRDGNELMRSCGSLLKPKQMCLSLRVTVSKGSHFVFNNWQKLQCALDPLQYALDCSSGLPATIPGLARDLLVRITGSSAVPRALCHQTSTDGLKTAWHNAAKMYGVDFLATALSLFITTMPKNPSSWRYSGRPTVSRTVVSGSNELECLRLLYLFYCLMESPTLARLPEIVDRDAPGASEAGGAGSTAAAADCRPRPKDWTVHPPEPREPSLGGVFSPPNSANSSAVSVNSLASAAGDESKDDGWTVDALPGRTASSGATANPQLCLPRTDTLTQRLRQFSGCDRQDRPGDRQDRLGDRASERMPVSPPQDSVLAQLKRQHSVVHLGSGGDSQQGAGKYARSESVLQLDGKTTLLPPIGVYAASFCPDLAVQACGAPIEAALTSTMRREALFLEKCASTLVVDLDAKTIEHWTLKDDTLTKARAEPKTLSPAARQIVAKLRGDIKQAFEHRFDLEPSTQT